MEGLGDLFKAWFYGLGCLAVALFFIGVAVGYWVLPWGLRYFSQHWH